ncbi:MAG: phosphoribosylaminoimidazolesuccinocarboxamide synthase [Clostridia bacterium]
MNNTFDTSALEQVYEGKAKKVFKTDNENEFIIEYKDDATAFNGQKKGTISGKGVINNVMSAKMFEMLEKHGIETHHIELLSDRASRVKNVTIIPLEVIVRNIAAGSFCQRLGVEEGLELKRPLFEICYKDDNLGDPFITEEIADILDLGTKEQIATIKEMALKINEIMKVFFLEKNILLVDYKLEFGMFDGRIVLADEISPDTCRFWDKNTKEKLDKDRFRRDLGNISEAYEEIMRRLTGE